MFCLDCRKEKQTKKVVWFKSNCDVSNIERVFHVIFSLIIYCFVCVVTRDYHIQSYYVYYYLLHTIVKRVLYIESNMCVWMKHVVAFVFVILTVKERYFSQCVSYDISKVVLTTKIPIYVVNKRNIISLFIKFLLITCVFFVQ